MTVENPRSSPELPGRSRRWVGRSVKRVEDPVLLTGRTEFIDNLRLPGMLHCAILRSPHAHARIRRIDATRAESLAGVAAVITGEDARRWSHPLGGVPEGWGVHCLAMGRTRFAGEAVAAVAASSRAVAEDALERIDVDYQPLPATVDLRKALEPESPLVSEEKHSNVMLHRVFTWGAVDEAFGEADRVFEETFRCHRLGANPIETFGVISQWDPLEKSLTAHGSYQVPGFFALGVAAGLGLPTSKVRLISHPHGGSFGGKGGVRGNVIGATGEGNGTVSAVRPIVAFTGCYTIPAARYDLTLVATRKLPQSSYRGMGLTAHNFVLEQMMDIAARGLGMDPAEIRRRNYIPPDRFPYTIPSGNRYDSGSYEAALDRVLEMSNYENLRREQAEAQKQGRTLGIGVVNTIEPGVFSWNLYSSVLGGLPGTSVPEGVRLSFDLFGKITARVGFPLEGQGQYTIIAQLLADCFGLEPGDVQVVAEDTLSAPPHFGPGGSRQAVALSGAVLGAADLLREKLIKVAARLVSCGPEEVELIEGRFQCKGSSGPGLPLADVAAVMLTRADLLPPGVEPSPEATYVWVAPGQEPADEQARAHSYLTAASSCHLVVVEVDAETGKVRILDYHACDDCGVRLNPAIVEGMIDGGLAQGVGAALLEEYAFDDQGQLLTSTLADYLLPTVYEVPPSRKAALETPSPFTALGAKGMGEAAMLTTQAAVMSAINDALVPLGVRATETPATPDRLWRVIERSRSARTGEGESE